MFTARFRHSVSLLLLAFFLITKIAGLHVLTHDDSDLADDCAICHVLATENRTPVVLQEAQEFPLPEFQVYFQEKIIADNDITVQDRLYPYHLFSRPPPAI